MASHHVTGLKLSRYKEHPLPTDILEALRAQPAIQETCRTVFGYELDSV